ncbi:hypothetical protein [Kitasatospora sp. NPDC056531]
MVARRRRHGGSGCRACGGALALALALALACACTHAHALALACTHAR